MNLRSRAQTLIRRLVPFGGPASMDFFVPRPSHDVGREVAAALDLDPSGHHLVFSPIGVGKTTELLHVRSALTVNGDGLVVYVDPAEEPGAMEARSETWLLQRCALALSGAVIDRGHRSSQRARQAAERLFSAPHSYSALSVPETQELLSMALDDCTGEPVVVLLDSLDREPVGRFDGQVLGSLRSLHALGIGLVLTAPFESLYAPWREKLGGFSLHGISPARLDEPLERDWLREVLRKRDSEDVITAEARERLLEASGGVPRQLIEFARDAVTAAYQAGSGAVTRAYVDAACERYVYNHLLPGLTPDDRAVIAAVASGRGAPTGGQSWIGLVASGRILEHPQQPIPHTVHPLLAPHFVRRAA